MKAKIVLCLIILGVLYPHQSCAKTLLPFDGHINLLDKEYTLEFHLEDEGLISTHVTEQSKNKFQIKVNVKHFKTPLVDLSTELEGLLEVVSTKDEEWSLSGKVWSQYSLVNFKPIREFSGRFEIKKNRLFLDPIVIGPAVCRGFIDLNAPHKVDLELDLTAIPMPDFLSFFVDDMGFDSEGPVSGKIQIAGDITQVYLKGQLSSYNGFVKDLEFESIHLNAEGLYPNIYIADSRITQLDGMIFSFGGMVNLADQANFKKQIKALTKAPLVNVSESDLEWTFKRLKGDDERGGTTELKYLFRKNLDLQNSQEEGMDMFGVERTIEF